MPTNVLRLTSAIGGVSFDSSLSVEGEGSVSQDVTLAEAKAGTLTTRTDNDTGVCTLSSGHGIVSSDVVDVYWADGSRLGMTATVSGTAVTVDGGAGDNLPAQSTDVTVCVQTEMVLSVDPTIAKAAVFTATGGRATVQLVDENDSIVISPDIPASGFWLWAEGLFSNPMGSSLIVSALLSNASSTSTSRVKIGFALDSVS